MQYEYEKAHDIQATSEEELRPGIRFETKEDPHLYHLEKEFEHKLRRLLTDTLVQKIGLSRDDAAGTCGAVYDMVRLTAKFLADPTNTEIIRLINPLHAVDLKNNYPREVELALNYDRLRKEKHSPTLILQKLFNTVTGLPKS